MTKLAAAIGLSFSFGIACSGVDAQQASSSADISYLANFTHRTGQHPASQPILASDGNYYGVLPDGALHDAGSVYRLTPDGTVTAIHKFKGEDGQRPLGRLLQANDGALYGTTYEGGNKGCGTVFRMTLNGEFHVLHVFNCRGGGGNPAGGVIQGADGRLYGTTQSGGRRRDGVLYAITLADEYGVLGDFHDQYIGAKPVGELLQTDDGGFLGIASVGVGGQGGTLYSFSPEGVFDREYAFRTGANPNGSLVFAPGRELVYGTLGNGIIFQYNIKRSGMDIAATVEFGAPSGGLTQGPNGSTYFGFCTRPDGRGCAYTMVPDGKITFLTGSLKGTPHGNPSVDANGVIVGTTQSGGAKDSGAAFEASVK